MRTMKLSGSSTPCVTSWRRQWGDAVRSAPALCRYARADGGDVQTVSDSFLVPGRSLACCPGWQVEDRRPRASEGSPLRYSDLRARIPSLTDKVLNDRLRDLQAQGLVSRRKAGRRGSPSTYELTRRGRSLGPVLQALHDWGAVAAPSLGVTVGIS